MATSSCSIQRAALHIEVFNQNQVMKDALVGYAEVPLSGVRRASPQSMVQSLKDKHGSHAGEVELELRLEGQSVRGR